MNPRCSMREWQRAVCDGCMLNFLRTTKGKKLLRKTLGVQEAVRRLRLFHLAKCRRDWAFAPSAVHREVAELTERYADGLASRGQLETAHARLLESVDIGGVALHWLEPVTFAQSVYEASNPRLGWSAFQSSPVDVCANCRAVFSFSKDWPERKGQAWYRKFYPDEFARAQMLQDLFTPMLSLDYSTFGLDNANVQEMAREIYTSSDYQAMPVLGDALEEAGCQEPMLLDHCRTQTVHVHGCWLLEWILNIA